MNREFQSRKIGAFFPLPVLILLGFLFAASGCTSLATLGAGGAAGAGGVAYTQGDLETRMNYPPDRIAKATEEAFKTLGIEHEETSSSELQSEVKGTSTEDKQVLVKADVQEDDVSQVSIRVGVFGDREKSEAILKEIRSNL